MCVCVAVVKRCPECVLALLCYYFFSIARLLLHSYVCCTIALHDPIAYHVCVVPVLLHIFMHACYRVTPCTPQKNMCVH
jgi:hypothetical protein